MSREYCTVIGEMHIKDLDKIGRDLKHVIFVDVKQLIDCVSK